jgi:hypothetical protein
MKLYNIYILPFFLFHIVFANTNKEAQVKQIIQIKPPAEKSHDYAPEILGTFFQKIVPNFLSMAVAAEQEDSEQVWQSLAGMFEGVGAIVDYGTRALKENPKLNISRSLLTSMQTKRGKKLLQQYKKINC